MDKYHRTSISVGKLLSKKYGIHIPIYNNDSRLNNNYDKSIINIKDQISLGCLRCVGEWISAATYLIKSSYIDNIWDTDLGIELANSITTRRLSIGFDDFYQLVKFFALIKNDKLDILPQLLDVQLKSFIQSELDNIDSRLYQLPLLLYTSNYKIYPRIIEFIKFISERIRSNYRDARLNDITSLQIGLSNLGHVDHNLMKLLNSKIFEFNEDTSHLQLYNISLLANASSFIHDVEFYDKIIHIINRNLNSLPLDHIATHTLSRAIIANIYQVDNSELFNTIIKNYNKMTINDKIITLWSIISLDMDSKIISNLLNDIFNPNYQIPIHMKIFMDQIYLTAKLKGYMPNYSISNLKSPNTLSNPNTNDLEFTLKNIFNNINIKRDIELPYNDFNLIFTLNDYDYKGITITLYRLINDNPLLWDPYYIIRRRHLNNIGYKDVHLPENWYELSENHLKRLIYDN